MSYKIGIDVGGTNTDAVLLRDNRLIAKYKTTTSEDITGGIISAIRKLIAEHPIAADNIQSINLGTTHLVNAFIQKQGLIPVMVIRLSGPIARSIPPCTLWPEEVRKSLVGEEAYFASGGYEYTGKAIAPIKPEEIRWAANHAKAKKIKSIAVIGVFSNVNSSQEEEVKAILIQTHPEADVTLSHKMGSTGLIARENASILNAASLDLFQRIAKAFQAAVVTLGIRTNVYLTYGDGTKTQLGDIHSSPLKTFHSGPSNSIMGAQNLTDYKEAVTVDIGGTSCDIGILKEGRPVYENSSFPITGLGVTCNFVLPRLHSFGLGGGSVIRFNGEVTIGPDSVGNQLTKQALVFGGDKLTPTDIAVALGRLQLGLLPQKELLQKIAQFAQVQAVQDFISKIDFKMHEMLVAGVKDTLASMEEIPPNLVLIGGGALLFDRQLLKKMFDHRFTLIDIPESGDVANALGAAISKIGAKHVQVYDYVKIPQALALAEVTQKATELAIRQGADPKSIQVSERSEVQIPYLEGQPNEVTVAVVGSERASAHIDPMTSEVLVAMRKEPSLAQSEEAPTRAVGFTSPSVTTRPQMQGCKDLSKIELENICMGGGLLGSGGGGSPLIGLHLTLSALEGGKKLRTLPLNLLPDDASVALFGGMGSPVILAERLPSIEEGILAIETLQKKLGKALDAIIIAEGAGFNCTYPLYLAALLDLPVIDADCMGRAFPGLQMITPSIYGKFVQVDAAISNGLTTKIAGENQGDFIKLENEMRGITVEMGGATTIVIAPMSGAEAKRYTIPDTLTIIERLGASIRATEKQPFSQRIQALNGVLSTTEYQKLDLIFEGEVKKVVTNNQEIEGFSVGGFIIENSSTKKRVGIGFQNENLFAQDLGTGELLAQVPEIITIVDPNTLQVISCGEYRFGQRVAVLRIPSRAKMTTPEALKVVGPEVFPLATMRKLLGIN